MNCIQNDLKDCNIISTEQDINYGFAIKKNELFAIVVAGNKISTKYYFTPKENQQKVSRQILERALDSLLCSNPHGFDILCACFYGLKEHKEYIDVATRVYKEHMNKLYNLAFAEDIWRRETK